MGPECEYSFADLFRAVRGRDWTIEEQAELESLPQPDRNAWVKKLAQAAEGRIATEDRLGTDGQVYTAFWPVAAQE